MRYRFAEFDLDVLESSLREVRLLIDPEIQVTSIEYGDGGLVAWELQSSDQGPVPCSWMTNSSNAFGEQRPSFRVS